MKLSTLSYLLHFSGLATAAVIPRIDNSTDTMSIAATGYKNVAYFVNWVSPRHGLILAALINTLVGYLWSEFPTSKSTSQ
jgi:hypothetical protein